MVDPPELAPTETALKLTGQVKELSAKLRGLAPGENPGSASRTNRFKQFGHTARLGTNRNVAQLRESGEVLRRPKKGAYEAWQLPLLRVKDHPESLGKSQERCVRRASTRSGLGNFEVIKEVSDWNSQPAPRKRDDEGR